MACVRTAIAVRFHFTFCGEDDVPSRLSSVLEGQGFNLNLVSNADHCVAFTNQLEAATVSDD